MAELRILRLFGNPLEFLPEKLPLHQLRHLSLALTSLASDVSVALQLMKCDIMQPVKRILTSVGPQELKSVLQVVGKFCF